MGQGMLFSVRALTAVLAASFLAGCTFTDGYQYGPYPELQAKDITRASDNYKSIINSLIADAGLGKTEPPTFYETTLAGYNFVDLQCSQYFSSLFQLDRDRAAVKSGLAAFGTTSNAILSLTGAAQVTINVVAQAFGLTSSLNDVVAGTYLYNFPPATTSKFVRDAMVAYKNATTEEQANSAPAAYSLINGYLNLCLPVTIEAMLVARVSNTQAIAEPDDRGIAIVNTSADAATPE